MIDGIAILIQAIAWVVLVILYLRQGKENEKLKERLDITVMKNQAKDDVIIDKIQNLQLPFLLRDNTELKMGYDKAKSDVIKLIEEAN